MANLISQFIKSQKSYNYLHFCDRILDRIFPERQLHLRTNGHISYFKISKNVQISCLGIFFVAFSWMVYSTGSYMLHGNIVKDKDMKIANTRLAYKSLLAELSEYQNKFTSIISDLEKNHAMMLGIVEKNTSLQQKMNSINTKLTVTVNERDEVISERESLKQQLSESNKEIQNTNNVNIILEKNVASVKADLQTVISARDQAQAKNVEMARNSNDLEDRLVSLQDSEFEAVQRLTNGTVAFIESMQKVVKMTGLKVDKLLKADGIGPVGQGGPFIAAKPDDLPAGRLKSDLVVLDGFLQHSEALQDVMSKLPLSAPLNKYRITSTYGKRRDPINKKWASHYGLDLGDKFKAKVYTTAPGIVTFAGLKGNYGKLIEIDHGAGLKTRYGHLNRTLVKKGQKVSFRDNIALLGSTGRSTGAHLHYEIVFRGKPRNPLKFIKAGRYVFQN